MGKLDNWLRGWESQRQIEEEASAKREEDLMGIARAALAEASTAKRAVEVMVEMFSRANGAKQHRPMAIHNCLHQPCGDTKLATQVERGIASKMRKGKVVDEAKIKEKVKAMDHEIKLVDKQKMKAMDETRMKTMEEKKEMETENSIGPEKEASPLEKKMMDKNKMMDEKKMMELEAIMEVDFMAAELTQEETDLEMTDQAHGDRNVEMQRRGAESDMEKRKGQVEPERTPAHEPKMMILKCPPTKTLKPTWAAVTRQVVAIEGTTADNDTKSIRTANKAPVNRVTASDMAIRKHVKPDERRIVFARDSKSALLLVDQTIEITSATNIALHLAGVPGHIRIERLQKSRKGTLTAAAARGATANMVIKFKEIILKAIRKYDPGIVDLQTNEDWSRVMVYAIELSRYGKSPEGRRMLRQEKGGCVHTSFQNVRTVMDHTSPTTMSVAIKRWRLH